METYKIKLAIFLTVHATHLPASSSLALCECAGSESKEQHLCTVKKKHQNRDCALVEIHSSEMQPSSFRIAQERNFFVSYFVTFFNSAMC
jgi:hypothetical protein